MFSLSDPLRPPIPRSQTAALRASRGNAQIAAPGRWRVTEGSGRDDEALSTSWEADERMQSGAELTGVQSVAWLALIIADVFKGALKSQSTKSPKYSGEEEKKVKMAFMMSFNRAQCPLEDKLLL